MEAIVDDITRQRSILIVDDDEGLNSLLQRVVKRAGFSAKGAGSGTAALELLAQEKFDLILLDYQLSDMSADKLVELLRAAGVKTPFVIMTGHGDEKIAVAMMKAGARDYLIKDGNYIDMLPHVLIRLFKDLDVEQNLRRTEAELVQSQAKLKTEHEQLLSIYECITDSICVIDVETHSILYSNPTFQEYFGTSSFCYESICKKGQPCADCPTYLCGQNSTEAVYSEYQNSANKRWYKCIDKLIRWTDGKSAHFHLAEDITAIKESGAEILKAKLKAEESDRLKSAFLANLSHEIRTPMNAIMGFTDLLMREDFSQSKQRDLLVIVRERSEYLLHIINDLLDISRIEVGQMEIIRHPGDLGELFDELYDYYLTKYFMSESHKNIELRKSMLLKGSQCKINGDMDRIKQVLCNLMDNALKFTSSGVVEFGCRLKESELVFYVKDTGIGISNSMQTIIFDRFRQVNDVYLSRRTGGVGLGLSISKGLVELMCGRIWVESVEGEGSVFYFSIPYEPIESFMPDEQQTDNNEYDWSQRTILIVEDEPVNATLLVEYLDRTRVNSLLVSSCSEAMKIFIDKPDIELVLMDIRLPDGNGIELAQKMKAIRPDITIIAQTAYAYANEREMMLTGGCNGYITKPIRKEELLRTIDMFFHSSGTQPPFFKINA
jgi:signal transduction histidine kinase/DNA-binding response OmpR family regulator